MSDEVFVAFSKLPNEILWLKIMTKKIKLKILLSKIEFLG